MPNVWMAHTSAGSWPGDPSTGYAHSLSFSAFADVPALLVRRGITDIGTLAVVAHGDSPGVVVVSPTLTPTTVPSSSTHFTSIAARMQGDGKFIFYACIAGRGPEGSALLTAISRYLPGRRIIGFELWGEYSALLPNQPGNVGGCSAPTPDMQCFPQARHGRLSPWGDFAKWAIDGTVIRYPILEQNGRPGLRCANPACSGHHAPRDQCSGWHPACEW